RRSRRLRRQGGWGVLTVCRRSRRLRRQGGWGVLTVCPKNRRLRTLVEDRGVAGVCRRCVGATAAVDHRGQAVPRVGAATLVGTSPVRADSAAGLRPLPSADAIRCAGPSHRSRRCAELPLMVQTSPIAGFLIPVATSVNSLAAGGRHL